MRGEPNDGSENSSNDTSDSESETVSGVSHHYARGTTILERMPRENRFLNAKQAKGQARRLVGPVLELTLAGGPDDEFFNVRSEPGHEDDIIRVLAKVIYFRYKVISDDHIRTHLAPPRFKTKDANYELVRLRALQWQSAFKADIMRFYRNGVKKTCKVMGGKQYFETTTGKERMKLWEAIFDSAPLIMAKASVAGLVESLPLDEIFSAQLPVHEKWRKFLKTTFMFTAEDFFRFSYMTKSQDEIDARFMSFPVSEKCGRLELGGLEDVPVRKGGPYDQGRRKVPQAIEYDSDYEIPVGIHVDDHL